MKIDATTFAKLPEHLQVLFIKVPNPGRDEVLAGFPHTASGVPGVKRGGNTGAAYGAESRQPGTQMTGFGDSGSAARFFYCAKASRTDRNAGLSSSDAPAVAANASMREREREDADWPARNGNHHPTVKPTDLMAYLCRLVTPPGGIVLDPFMGSGSTGKAAMREGFRFIGCELSPEFLAIAEARIEFERLKHIPASNEPGAVAQPDLFGVAA